MAFNLDNRLTQTIQQIGQNYAIEQIVLFGSRARGDNKLISDIDLAVFPMPEFDKRGSLTSDLDDIETLLKLDIVFIDEQTDPGFRDNVVREGVILYERCEHKTQ